MKNSIFLLLFWLLQSSSLFAQYPSQQVNGVSGISNSTASIHLTSTIGQTIIGSGSTSNCLISQGFIQGTGVPLDSLPYYNIGDIPKQTAYQEADLVFYVWSKDLGINADLSIEVLAPAPTGELKFSEITKRFSFKASAIDEGEFIVIFRAILNQDTVWQEVPFDIIPQLAPEQTAFGLTTNTNSFPSDDDDSNIIITETSLGTGRSFNHGTLETYSISIAGKTLIFDTDVANKLKKYCDNIRNDIESINIYAEKIVIRSPLNFPQTKVHIQTRNITFEGDSYINTKPKDSGINDASGLDAGNLSLHVESFTSTPAHRFRLIGGDGKINGNAGNGGSFISNINLLNFVDAPPGHAGDSGGNSGTRGSFSLEGGKYSWMHPFALRMVINHLKIAYLNGFNLEAQAICNDYVNVIDNYQSLTQWDSLSEGIQIEIQQMGQEMSTVSQRVSSNLDYFGNPAGWVPMLSFEVNKAAFEEEVGRAIGILYFCYWVQRENATNEQRISAIQTTRTKLQETLIKYQSEYIEASLLLPQLENKSQNITDEITILINDLEKLEAELLERATYLTIEANKPPKKSLWRKIAKTVGKIAQVVPIYQPVLGIVGTGLVAVSEVDFSKPLSAITDIGSVVADISTEDFKKNADAFKKAMDDIDFSKLKSNSSKEYVEFGKQLFRVSKPLIEGIDELTKKAQENGVSQDLIDAELAKLRAESPEFSDLTNKTNDLLSRKAQFFQEIDATLQTLTTLESNIQQGISSIDGLNLQASNASSNRNLRAMIYAKDMESRAKERLIKYHYYMKKAYEYRLLNSYPSDLNLPQLFDDFRQIVDNQSQGDSITLEPADFENLKAIYDDVLSTTTEQILNIYNTNAPEISAPLRFDLTAEDLETLNNQEAVNLNMVERGMFPSYEENIRIRGFKVVNAKLHFENGQPGSFAYFDMLMEHSGRSKLKKDGETYLFNHYNNQNTNPIVWGDRIDARSENSIDPKEPSPSVTSLLFSILEDLNKYTPENLVLYSRPGAWADIRISKNDVTSNGVKIVIDSLTFEVVYDFSQLPTSYSTVNVLTNDNLRPYINLNQEDINERQDGWGIFNRTFFQSSTGKVNMEAPLKYGAWVFDKWTDQFGNIISAQNSIDVSLASSRSVKANYLLIQPELHLPKDTIYLPNNGGNRSVQVENIGTGDMDWFCTGSEGWLSIVGDTTGLNNEEFQIAFDENSTGNTRIKELYVIAASSINYIDTITVIQDILTSSIDVPFNESQIKLSPNPVTNTLNIEFSGFIPSELQVFDITGKIMQRIKMNSTQYGLDVVEYPKGIFILRASDKNNNFFQKRFVKN